MVKNIMIVSFLMFFYLACDFTPLKDSAFVSFPLNPGDPSIVKVHMAVFEGNWDVGNLIMTTELTSSNSRVEVPIGNDLTFLFVASNNLGKGVYFGSQKNVYIDNNGGTNLQEVVMNRFDDTSVDPVLSFDYGFYLGQDDTFFWQDVGATQYTILHDNNESVEPYLVYIATGNTFYAVGSYVGFAQYAVVCYYSFFNIECIRSGIIAPG